MGAIQTNVVDPTNTPIVPQQFQTGSYYDPTQVVQNPPQPAMNNQMGTQPLAQKRTGEYYSKSTVDYSNSSSAMIPKYEQARKINKINLMRGKGPNLDSIQEVNPAATSDALKNYYSGQDWKKDINKSKEIYKNLSQEEQNKL